MANPNAPFHPIIYVRGYAMTPAEINETTADPFCGFNLGSTVYRAVPEIDRQTRKYIFESPVVRLASDFKYRDVFQEGYDILDKEWGENKEDKPPSLSSRSIIIYRYYEQASKLLGVGKVPSIEQFSRELGDLIERVRDLVCAHPENGTTKDTFRCYLVAHSMGGLVCRGLLQNPALDKKNMRQYVDKCFTYATPHNGIEMLGANIPAWLTMSDMNNFNRERMADYLDLAGPFETHKRVDLLPEGRFSPERVFCMVGTNRNDYEAAKGLSRTFAGHGSDGLVKIENATLMGLKAGGKIGDPCAKAFAYRSHSGFFGIVNSEEAYQNLTRFLFGNVRVDMWFEIEEIRLPPAVQAAADKDPKSVNALYQFEVLASPRGKLWYLTRRTSEEDSVACLSHQDWIKSPKKECRQYLSAAFLANRAKVSNADASLTYHVSLGVRVPDYEIDRRLWIDQHFEGGYMFRNSLILRMVPPAPGSVDWSVQYAWQDQGFRAADQRVDPTFLKNGKIEVEVDLTDKDVPTPAPGIKGKLRFVVSLWNPDAQMED